MIGMAGCGAGRIKASSRSKNSPWCVTGAPGEQRPKDAQGFVHAAPASTGIDAADLELVRVLATDTDAEGEPAGVPLGHRRELTGHQHGMAQGQQIHRHERSQRGFGGELVGRADEPVEAGADDEADVVAAHDMIETGRGDRTGRRRRRRVRGERGHTDRHHQ